MFIPKPRKKAILLCVCERYNTGWWRKQKMSPTVPGLLWKRQYEKVLSEHGWRKVLNWEWLFFYWEKGLFLSVYVDDLKLSRKEQNTDPMWKTTHERRLFGRTDIIPRPRLFWLHSTRMRNKQRYCGQIQNHVRISNFSRREQKRKLPYSLRKNLTRTFLHGPMTWKVMERNAWSFFANWRTKQLNNNTKSQLHALTITKKKSEDHEMLGRIVRNLLSDCTDMHVFDKNQKTKSTLDSTLLGKISHRVEPSMRFATRTSHNLHSPHI